MPYHNCSGKENRKKMSIIDVAIPNTANIGETIKTRQLSIYKNTCES